MVTAKVNKKQIIIHNTFKLGYLILNLQYRSDIALPVSMMWSVRILNSWPPFHRALSIHRQCCPQATAHSDFSSYSCHMRHLLFRDLIYFVINGIANVVVFATYSSQLRCLLWNARTMHRPFYFYTMYCFQTQDWFYYYYMITGKMLACMSTWQ